MVTTATCTLLSVSLGFLATAGCFALFIASLGVSWCALSSRKFAWGRTLLFRYCFAMSILFLTLATLVGGVGVWWLVASQRSTDVVPAIAVHSLPWIWIGALILVVLAAAHGFPAMMARRESMPKRS